MAGMTNLNALTRVAACAPSFAKALPSAGFTTLNEPRRPRGWRGVVGVTGASYARLTTMSVAMTQHAAAADKRQAKSGPYPWRPEE